MTAVTTSPLEPAAGPDGTPADVPAGDPGAGSPAGQASEGTPVPPGYPSEVDPAQGPAAGREGSALGDLRRPGAAG